MTNNPKERLRHHVTGAIERGEATAVVEQRAPTQAECERMVRQEVLCCVSGLVSTLAQGYGAVPYQAKTRGMIEPGNMLASLCEKAAELAAPVDDWEEAAMQAGFKYCAEGGDSWPPYWSKDGRTYDTAREACESADVEPYQREVYEHWAVTSWLAEKLIEQGEKVDTDFEGLNVWARTCTGQVIYIDGVIVRIVAATRYGMGS